MKWIVTVELSAGVEWTGTVEAPNKDQAETRAAFKCEESTGKPARRVKYCNRY